MARAAVVARGVLRAGDPVGAGVRTGDPVAAGASVGIAVAAVAGWAAGGVVAGAAGAWLPHPASSNVAAARQSANTLVALILTCESCGPIA